MSIHGGSVLCISLYFWICCFQPFPMASRHAHLPYRIQRTCYCRQNEIIPKVKAWSTTVPWISGRGEHNSQCTHLHALVCTCTIRVLHIRHDMTCHHITSNYILSHPPYSILTYYIRIHTSIHPHTHTRIYILYIHTSYRIPYHVIAYHYHYHYIVMLLMFPIFLNQIF